VLADAQRSGPLHDVLGGTRVRVVAAGRLRDGSRVLGATVLLELPAPRHNVTATVPGYVPVSGRGGPYQPISVRMRAATVRTLLLDIDVRARRVIAIEPGPGSVTTAWTPADTVETRGEDVAAARAALADSATRAPRLVRASPGGPAFLRYDGNASLDPRQRDWPVSLIFAGHATIANVKQALRGIGFTHVGHRRYLAYGAAAKTFDSDRGLKTACDAASTDAHVRLYAPPSGSFSDPRLGSVVVATVHLDRNDGCGVGPRLYGFSEVAEHQVASALQHELGWHVDRNRIALGNAEPLRRDVRDPAHVWLGNGRATVVNVP
jgi:hypothetical protein